MSADHVWTGVVMEYLGREKLAEHGRKVLYTDKGERKDAGSVGDPRELLKAVRDKDWNDYHVIVRSNLIVLRINDVVMSEVRDHDPRRPSSSTMGSVRPVKNPSGSASAAASTVASSSVR